MSNSTQKLLILLALIIFLVLILVFIFVLKKQSKRLQHLKHTVTRKTSEQRRDAIEAILKRVTNIASDNEKFQVIAKKLTIIYKTFIVEFKKIKLIAPQLITNITNTRFSFRATRIMYDQFMQLDCKINTLENNFNKLAQWVVAQDEHLQEKFYFYQKRLRQIANVYHERKILFASLATPIANFNKAINYIEKTFEKIIDKGDNLQAEILIQRYIYKVLTFAKIIDCAPSLAVQIKVQIPQAITKLKNSNLELIINNEQVQDDNPLAFSENLNPIYKPFRQAQKAFLKLDMEQTITKIKLTLIAIAQFEDKLKLENKARVVFKQMQNQILAQSKQANISWQKLHHEFEEYASSGKTISSVLFNKYNNTKTIFAKFKNEMDAYENALANKTSYLTCFNQAHLLLTTLKRAMMTANDFVISFRQLDLAKINTKSKFLHVAAIFSNIVSVTKQKNLALTSNDLDKITTIRQEKAMLAKALQGVLTTQLETKVERLVTLIAQLYALLSSKMQMAFHIRNMINECALRRASNPSFNANLQVAETKYLAGDYATSLNEIINCMRDVNWYT